MADEDDDGLGDWEAKLEDKNAPAIGVNKEMLRKALALNPSLRQGQSSTDMMAAIQQGHREKPVAGAAPRASGPKRTLADTVLKLKEEFGTEHKRLKAEIAALQAQEKALAPRICDRVVDAVMAIDPNMTSPMTQELMADERMFFTSIMFSAKKVLEKMRGVKR